MRRGALRLGGHDEEGEHDRRRAVDRHRHADLAQIDAAEEVLHVVEGVERDALAADLARLSGESESWPISDGMSNAVESALWPWSSR